MKRFEITDTGHVSRDDAAFPTLVCMPDGSLLCGYTAKGDGPNALGGTDLSRSSDRGRSWEWAGTILPRTDQPCTVNSLRLSRAPDGIIYAYGDRAHLEGEGRSRDFSRDLREPVYCTSRDNGHTWSDPIVLPFSLAPAYEISNPMVFPQAGHILAPAALLPDEQHLGEKVVLFASSDNGRTWPDVRTLFSDPAGEKGFFEQKVIPLGAGVLLGTAWTVTLGDYADLENHWVWSSDYGKTWSKPQPTGIQGQTLTPHLIERDDHGRYELLCLSNRRYGRQGVVAYSVTVDGASWNTENEFLLWDARASRNREQEETSGIAAFDDFAFGLPSMVTLDDGTFLAVHWCREDGVFGIRWTALEAK